MSGLVISGGVLELGGTSFGSGAITFAAPGGIAHFTPGSTALSNVLSGLDAGDSLFLDATPVNFSPVAFGVTDTATLSGSTQLHAVLNGTTYNFTLADLSPRAYRSTLFRSPSGFSEIRLFRLPQRSTR